jgi:hypothetical protein
MIDIAKLNEDELKQICPYISIVENQKMDIDTVGYGVSLELQGLGIRNSAKKDDDVYIGFQIHPRSSA